MSGDDAWRTELETEREMKNAFMARHAESPFVVGRVPFHDLVYFPPDPDYRVRAILKRVPVPEEAFLRTSRDNQAVMRYLGDLEFSLAGHPLRLRLFHAGEGVGTSVFVPFRDRTSGRESYGAGRYLTLELNESDEYECGFPPAENDLPVAVRAGEKVWAADRNPRTPSSALLARQRKGPPAPAPPSRARPRSRGAATKGGARRHRSR